jgi:hypothetical protein
MADLLRNAPDLITLDNTSTGNRGTRKVKMANSSVHYAGEFFDYGTGTDGAQTVAANQAIRGIVSSILVRQGAGKATIPVGDVLNTSYKGTYVAPTSFVPAKYTASSTNVTVAKEELLYYPINIGDRIEASLSNGAGGLAVKGTTTGSNLLNSFIEIDPDRPWLLLESSTASSATGLTFKIVGFPDNDPTGTSVIVELINATGAVS